MVLKPDDVFMISPVGGDGAILISTFFKSFVLFKFSLKLF